MITTAAPITPPSWIVRLRRAAWAAEASSALRSARACSRLLLAGEVGVGAR